MAKKIQKQMNISDFKARCLEIVQKLPEEGLLLTRRGEPIAKVFPMKQGSITQRFYGCLKDDIKILGDIFSTGEKWHAES